MIKKYYHIFFIISCLGVISCRSSDAEPEIDNIEFFNLVSERSDLSTFNELLNLTEAWKDFEPKKVVLAPNNNAFEEYLDSVGVSSLSELSEFDLSLLLNRLNSNLRSYNVSTTFPPVSGFYNVYDINDFPNSPSISNMEVFNYSVYFESDFFSVQNDLGISINGGEKLYDILKFNQIHYGNENIGFSTQNLGEKSLVVIPNIFGPLQPYKILELEEDYSEYKNWIDYSEMKEFINQPTSMHILAPVNSAILNYYSENQIQSVFDIPKDTVKSLIQLHSLRINGNLESGSFRNISNRSERLSFLVRNSELVKIEIIQENFVYSAKVEGYELSTTLDHMEISGLSDYIHGLEGVLKLP